MDDHSRKPSPPADETPSKKKYKGTLQTHGGWSARLWTERVDRIFGPFKSEEEAAVAHDKLAIKFHGVTAKLNFEQPEFAAQERFLRRSYLGEVIDMVNDGSYGEKFREFVETEKSQECRELFRKTIDAGEREGLRIGHHYASQFFPLASDGRKSPTCLHFTDSKGKNWTFRKKCSSSRDGFILGDQWVEFGWENQLKDGDSVIFCETKGGKRLMVIEGQHKELKEVCQERDPTDPSLMVTPSTSEHSASGIYRKVLSKADVEDRLTLENNGGMLEEFLLPTMNLALHLGNFELKVYDPAGYLRIFTGYRNPEDEETLYIKEGWKDLVDACKIAESDTLVLYRIEGDETESEKRLRIDIEENFANRLERPDSSGLRKFI